jgi:DNA-binding IclR family transcriptional regulator
VSSFSNNFDRIYLRRTWLVLGAISLLDRPSIASIANSLSFRKSTVQRIVDNFNNGQLLQLEVESYQPELNIKDWGMLNQGIVERYYQKYREELQY